jgi:hypothetical protein
LLRFKQQRHVDLVDRSVVDLGAVLEVQEVKRLRCQRDAAGVTAAALRIHMDFHDLAPSARKTIASGPQRRWLPIVATLAA